MKEVSPCHLFIEMKYTLVKFLRLFIEMKYTLVKFLKYVRGSSLIDIVKIENTRISS